MRWLLFLSRLAFICGIFVILSFSLQVRDWTDNQNIIGTIIIIGYLFGFVVIPLVNICYLVVSMLRRRLHEIVPPWLVISNILFLILLLVYIIYQNAAYNHS